MSDATRTAATTSMKGGGYYSESTRGAKDVIDNAADMLLEAVAALPDAAPGTHVQIADYGTADGGTSKRTIAATVGAVCALFNDPPTTEIYTEIKRPGFCHSVEAWDESGELVGGAFGTAVGGLFIAESQFYRTPNASKCAYVVLNRHLQSWGFSLVDAKRGSPFMYQQGYQDMPRADYIAQVAKIADQHCGPGTWAVDETLDVAGWKPALADAE